MGKYLPIIVTADCGSLTRAGEVLGYAQPNMGHIVTRIEDELGVKIFSRDQRGVRLTRNGAKLLDTMKQIEVLESHLSERAYACQRAMLRVGVFPEIASQWMPEVIAALCKEYPDATVQMKGLAQYIDAELGVKNDTLDCAFFSGPPPAGMQSVPLLEDPYYLVVSEKSELADLPEVSVNEVAGKYPFISTEESCDPSGTAYDIFQLFAHNSQVKTYIHGNSAPIALVEQNVGITIFPRLALYGMPHLEKVRIIPFRESLTRPISLLYPKESEYAALTTAFLRLTQKRIESWKQAEH